MRLDLRLWLVLAGLVLLALSLRWVLPARPRPDATGAPAATSGNGVEAMPVASAPVAPSRAESERRTATPSPRVAAAAAALGGGPLVVRVVRAAEGTPIGGAQVAAHWQAEDGGPWQHVVVTADGDGLAPLPQPAREWRVVAAGARGFCYAEADAWRRQGIVELRLVRSRLLTVRVTNVPPGVLPTYRLEAILHGEGQYMAAPLHERIGGPRCRAPVVVGEPFVLEHAYAGEALLAVVAVHRAMPCEEQLASVAVAPEQVEVEVDVGAQCPTFRDPWQSVDVRVRFATAAPVGAFDVELLHDFGAAFARASAMRRPEDSVVQVPFRCIPAVPARARVTCGERQWQGPRFVIGNDPSTEVEVASWVSLAVRCEPTPAGAPLALLVVDAAGRSWPARALGGGAFAVDALPPGVYRVGAECATPRLVAAPVEVAVHERRTREVTLALRRVHPLRVGVLRRDPCAGEVTFERDGRIVDRIAYEQGSRWAAAELAPGTYVVTARFGAFVQRQRLDLVADGAVVRFEEVP